MNHNLIIFIANVNFQNFGLKRIPKFYISAFSYFSMCIRIDPAAQQVPCYHLTLVLNTLQNKSSQNFIFLKTIWITSRHTNLL